ncbi:hypothetical protein XH88_12655 [Bradyrhizobium sp. CCBAU 51627]|nr:hypothetical protein [Bradyrhizobium sp. CCBAU 51627]
MYVESILIAELHWKRLNQCKVIIGKRARIVNAVAIEGLLAPICPPVHKVEVRAIRTGSTTQHFLMIATKEDEAILFVKPLMDQKLDDPFGVGSSIDIVANTDKAGVSSRTNKLACRD